MSSTVVVPAISPSIVGWGTAVSVIGRTVLFAVMSELLYEVSDHIATLTFNRPDRMNTISGPMLYELSKRLLRSGP